MIGFQGGPAHPRVSSPGRLDQPPSIEPLARRWAARSPSVGLAGCAFPKHKEAGESPNTKAAEPAACGAPATLAWAARSVGRLRAQSPNNVTNPKRLDSPAALARAPSQSCWSRCLRVPRTKLLGWLINGLIDCQGPHLQNSQECDPGREKSETNPSNHCLLYTSDDADETSTV